jgi:2-polyprenyl-3-methyl-5-hydroxy-6-metoxy-1,4-benzoquinol methylase
MKTIYLNEGIEVQSVPVCYLCGTQGQELYAGLRDRLFGAPGEWSLKRCPSTRCGLVWLNPKPTDEDLHKVYETYYTHQTNADEAANRKVQSIFLNPFSLTLKLIYHILLHLTNIHRALPKARLDIATMYLANDSPGRLLDVGCGNGILLERMRSLGWDVQGVEVDHKAAQVGKRTFGVDIYIGTLEKIKYHNASFDAITLNHVIEHVSDPIGLLKECYRILKPSGHLVAVTPNLRSLGHGRFGRNWIDLDPPRHLHLFSPSTIETIANKAGFQKIEVWTTPVNADWRACTSLDIQSRGYHIIGHLPSLSRIVKSRWFQLRAFADHRKSPESGEEAVLRATR